jgi:hypothetical protein
MYENSITLGGIFLLLSFAPVNAELQKEIERGDNWILYHVAGNYSFYYDKTSIKQQSNKHTRVWIRAETEAATAEVNGKGDGGSQTRGQELLSYSLILSEIDCNNKQIGDVLVTDYDNKGNVLKSFDFKEVQMRQIKPDTIAESLYKAVCKGEMK